MIALGKDLSESIAKALTLQEQTRKNTADIKEMRQELRDLAATVQRLGFEAQRDREMAAKDSDANGRDREKDRENLLLHLEVQLLRFGRRLQPLP